MPATEPSITDREPRPGGASPSALEAGRPLPAALLYRPCDPTELPFEQVTEIADLLEPIGQDRAVEAVQFAVAMRHKGYNVYALGASGTGKHTGRNQLVVATQPGGMLRWQGDGGRIERYGTS